MIQQQVGDLLEVVESGQHVYVVVLTRVVMLGRNILFAFHTDGEQREAGSLAPAHPGFNICADLLWPKKEGRVTELDITLEGRAPIQGDWADGATGLHDMQVEIAMMRTPDGHSRLELSRFLAPPVAADHRNAPVNALGYLRVMFAVDDLDDTLARLAERGGEVVSRVVQYQDVYRLCYIRGPDGILIGLAQQLGAQASRANPMHQGEL